MNVRNEIKAQTSAPVLRCRRSLTGWLTNTIGVTAFPICPQIAAESIRYKEAMELADVLDCDIVWVKRGARR